MVNHVRRHRSPQQQFTCDSAKIEAYYCKDCGFKTELTVLFKQHIDEHRDLKSDFHVEHYVCGKCGFETNSWLKWLQHTLDCCRDKKENDDVRWYYCAECPYKADVVDNLKRHFENTHFSNKHTYKKALKVHLTRLQLDDRDVGWHKCDKCPFKTKTKISLTRHVNTSHLNDDVKWHKCDECPFKTKYEKSLKTHVSRKHPDVDKIKWYECDNCSFRSRTKTQLNRHVEVHMEIKWHQCQYCSFKPKRSGSLKRHK